MLRKHADKYGKQWDRHLPGVLWVYRNSPHESTGEKPSYLLFGHDCISPTEAALLSPSVYNTATEVTDYRKELTESLQHARKLAATSIQKTQKRYKKYYDKKTTSTTYDVGDLVLVHFPQEESGSQRKLSRPWHGPYRVVTKRDPDIQVSKTYFPQEGNIQIHQSRVKPCPPGFPSGYYWYGTRRKSAGRPPKCHNSASKSIPGPSKDGSPKRSKDAGCPPKQKSTPRKKVKSSIKNVDSTETVPTARVELGLEREVM